MIAHSKRFRSVLEAAALAMALSVPASAYDEDLDTYREVREELASLRDSYIADINMAMEEANADNPEGWFNTRDKGFGYSWSDTDFEAPMSKVFTIEEIPYGFKVHGNKGEYKFNFKVMVATRDADIHYVVSILSGTNAAAKEIVNEVFKNEASDYHSPCPKDAVTCYKGRATYGKLRK